jgi:hypothetical protein
MDTSVAADSSTPVASKKKSLPLPTPAAKKEDKTPKSVNKIASDSVKKPPTLKTDSPRPAEAKVKKAAAETPSVAPVKSALERKTKAAETPGSAGSPAAGRPGRGEKRKPEEEASAASPVKKAARGGETAAVPAAAAAKITKDNNGTAAVDSPAAGGEKVSRSGRLIKPKKFEDADVVASSPIRSTDTGTDTEVSANTMAKIRFFL